MAGRSRLYQIGEGLVYLWANKLVLGAISLDLFAVLLGGATGLLPVFARDVLAVGPHGFGILRASPAVGAVVMAGVSDAPADSGPAGVKMLLAVGLYGVMTVVFAYSRWVPLSVFSLAVLGGADMVSVFTASEPGADRDSGPDAGACVGGCDVVHRGIERAGGVRERGGRPRAGPVGSVAFGGVGAIAVTACGRGCSRRCGRPIGWCEIKSRQKTHGPHPRGRNPTALRVAVEAGSRVYPRPTPTMSPTTSMSRG